MHVRNGTAVLCALLLMACGGDDADTDGMAADSVATPAPAPAPAADAQPAGTLLDPETATREQLVAVPGMTEAAADALIAARPFQTMLDVDRVLAGSLDEGTRENVYRAMWKPLDLNTASGEEILLIPNLGERMRHEFEEYRPYTDLAQFRREMAKYVDDAEVERLVQYVTIR